MFACILAFLGIYVAVLGLACFVMQMQWQVTVFNMSVLSLHRKRIRGRNGLFGSGDVMTER